MYDSHLWSGHAGHMLSCIASLAVVCARADVHCCHSKPAELVACCQCHRRASHGGTHSRKHGSATGVNDLRPRCIHPHVGLTSITPPGASTIQIVLCISHLHHVTGVSIELEIDLSWECAGQHLHGAAGATCHACQPSSIAVCPPGSQPKALDVQPNRHTNSELAGTIQPQG